MGGGFREERETKRRSRDDSVKAGRTLEEECVGGKGNKPEGDDPVVLGARALENAHGNRRGHESRKNLDSRAGTQLLGDQGDPERSADHAGPLDEIGQPISAAQGAASARWQIPRKGSCRAGEGCASDSAQHYGSGSNEALEHVIGHRIPIVRRREDRDSPDHRRAPDPRDDEPGFGAGQFLERTAGPAWAPGNLLNNRGAASENALRRQSLHELFCGRHEERSAPPEQDQEPRVALRCSNRLVRAGLRPAHRWTTAVKLIGAAPAPGRLFIEETLHSGPP
jgi:hypothetical protein